MTTVPRGKFEIPGSVAARPRLSFRSISPLYFLIVTLLVLREGLFAAGGRIFSATGHDFNLAYVPFLKFGFGQMAAGRIPLWNPHAFCGLPFVGNIQSALFYPPNWLHLLAPTSVAINWSVALHLFLAGWFTSLWCRRRGLSTLACLLAGTVFMFSAGYFLHLYAGHLGMLGAMAWSPLVFLVVEALFADPSLRWVIAGIGVVTMSILAGHPQTVYYSALAVGLYSLLRMGTCRHRLRLVACLMAVYAGAAALSAIQLLPTIQQAAESSRAGGVSYRYASFGSLPPEALASFVNPQLFGKPLEISPEGYRIIPAEGAQRFGYVGRELYWEDLLYCGAAALVLAIYGALRGERKQRQHAGLIVMALIVLAMGAYTPLFRPLFNYFPGYGSFRVTGRFNFLIALHVAMLAAVGLDTAAARIKRLDWAAWGVLALAGVVAIGGWAIRPDEKSPQTSLWARQLGSALPVPLEKIAPAAILETGRQFSDAILRGGVVMILAAGALLVATRKPRWRLAAASLAMGELILFALLNVPMAPESLPMPPQWRAGIDGRPAGSRVLTSRLSHANTGMIEGYDDIHGYDPVVPQRYLDLFSAAVGADLDAGVMPEAPTDSPPPLFRMLRLGVFLKQQPGRAGAEPPSASPLPRALLVPSAVVITDPRAQRRALRHPAFDPTAQVILEEPPETPLPGGKVEGQAQAVEHGTDELEITATTARPAVLLITDGYSKHWKAEGYADSAQRAYRVLPANRALRAIVLPAGTHHIRMMFAPSGFAIGRIITLGGLVVYVAAAGWLWRGRQRRQRVAPANESGTLSP